MHPEHMYCIMTFYRIKMPFARAKASEKPASPHGLKPGGLRRVPHGQFVASLYALHLLEEFCKAE